MCQLGLPGDCTMHWNAVVRHRHQSHHHQILSELSEVGWDYARVASDNTVRQHGDGMPDTCNAFRSLESRINQRHDKILKAFVA